MADDPDDDKTERELRKVRQESKDRRLRIQELEELTADLKAEATNRDKELLKFRTTAEQAQTALAEYKATADAKIKDADTTLAAKIAEITTAKDGEIAEIRKGVEHAEIATAVREAALAAGVKSPSDFVKLVDISKVKRDTDGKITGVAELIDAEKKGDRGYFFGDQTTTTKPGQQPPSPGKTGPVDARTMTDAEYKQSLRDMGVDLRL